MEIKKENYYTVHEENKIETLSLEDLKNSVDQMCHNAMLNNRCTCDVPVYFMHDGKTFELSKWSLGLAFGKEMQVQIEFDDYLEVKYVAPDSRPAEGEYWTPRGPSDFDCSGFVVSKAAGERLRRMVRLVLEKDETDSWLDFREREPNWIQFKFSANEFDIEKLDRMATENGNVLTIRTLIECKK